MNFNFKIKKTVEGFNAKEMKLEKVFVQVTKDNLGMSISINEYTIPIEPLELDIILRKQGDSE